MYPKANFISRNADLFRRVCRLPLAAYEQSMAEQLERAENLFVRHCQHVRTGQSRTPAVPNWEFFGESIRSTVSESRKAPPELVTNTPARSPVLIQAAGEAPSFPDALTGLVAPHADRAASATRPQAVRAA